MDALGRNTKNNPNSFNLYYNSSAIQKNSSSSSASTSSTYLYISSSNIISPHALGQIRYNNIY